MCSLLHLEIYSNISSNSQSEDQQKTWCKPMPFCEEWQHVYQMAPGIQQFPTIRQLLLNCRPSVCHLSTKDEQTVGWLMAVTSPTLRQHFTVSWPLVGRHVDQSWRGNCWLTNGWLTTNCGPTNRQQPTDERPTDDRLMANSRLISGCLLADSRSTCVGWS